MLFEDTFLRWVLMAGILLGVLATADLQHSAGRGTTVLAGDSTADAIPVAIDFPGKLRLTMPETLDAVVGVESNIYFDNLVLTTNTANFAFDVHCPKGIQQEERWTWTPTAVDVGTHVLVVEVRNDANEVVARGRTNVRVAAADAGARRDITVLFVGDSLTHASVYPRHVLERCNRDGNPRLRLIGSHQPAGVPEAVRHEGYGGWTAERFATHFAGTARMGDYGKRASPFLYPDQDGKPQLDFKAYCRDVNAGSSPDVVCFFLGPNDIFGYTDADIESGITRMLRNLELLVAMVRRDAPETDVAILMPVPPAVSQDAFGANYSTGQTRWQYRRNQHRLVERIQKDYGGRAVERVHLIATDVNLDCRHNYPATEALRNGATAQTGIRQSNGVHPDASGYQQIGDAVYAWLKGRWSSK